MSSSKKLQYLLIAGILSIVFHRAHAQINEKTYRHKMSFIDSLSFYKMKDYDTLYKISVLYTIWGHDYPEVYYGWVNKREEDNIQFINTNGKQIEIWKEQITGINQLPINDTTIAIFFKDKGERFRRHEFGENYLLSLWLYKKGKYDYSKRLLPENDTLFRDSDLRNDFGIIHYDAMLSAFTNQRNYPKAIDFGNHLSGNIFSGYRYQNEIIALTRQLKNNTGDFKTFRIPDSLEWVALKQKLRRKEQILYLADRLRLLNCVQPGQPGGINYYMPQFSISFAEAGKLGIRYWDNNHMYGVINPFIELLKMKLNTQEMELLLPYLLTDTYIASYSYFRDFFSDRTLHKQSWVVQDIMFEMTNKIFFDGRRFDSLSYDQKKIEVEKIKKWCDKNATVSKEDMTISVLKTSNDWTEFKKALNTARREKYRALLPVIVERYNDFKDFYWPVNKYLIAETVYELGNKEYIGTVRRWSKDINGIRDDARLEVKLWTSLYLLKYDKGSYEYAMDVLESVLKQCDGLAYYPHAMDLLLSMKNDKRALKLAEGILNKEGFQNSIYWDYYLSFVKKLLLLKNDYTFSFINERLGSFTPEEIESFNKNNGNVNIQVKSDNYVMVVDKLKSDKPGYNPESDFKTRLEYKKALSKWFATQYRLFKNGRPNELHLNVGKESEPVTFVDAPNR